MDYTEINAQTVDRWVDGGWKWGVPVTHEEFLRAKSGDWQMVLTPKRTVPKEWYPPLGGTRVLGLASGGGQQMPIFAALGAVCTVLDYSERQLESEKLVAGREGYRINIVRADMSKPLPFDDGAFDLIFHPVSNCYIKDVLPLWRECFRVLSPGGLMMAGLDNGINYIFDDSETRLVHSLPFDPISDPSLMAELQKDDSGVQFSHTLDEQIRGQIQAGLAIKDLYEDINDYGALAEHRVPTFWATLAQKPLR